MCPFLIPTRSLALDRMHILSPIIPPSPLKMHQSLAFHLTTSFKGIFSQPKGLSMIVISPSLDWSLYQSYTKIYDYFGGRSRHLTIVSMRYL